MSEYRYEKISKHIEYLITKQVFKLGDRIPSVREVSREQGVSMSTVLQAFYELESRSLIESRPNSGFYVSFSPKNYPEIPSTSRPGRGMKEYTANDILEETFENIQKKNFTHFSLGVPANELLPIAKLNKGVMKATRSLTGSGTSYEEINGNIHLRKQIARRAFTWQGKLSAADVITTSGCINALAYCLMALTSPGDTIAVESPVYFGILQLAASLKLKVVEVATNPVTGMELDAVKKLIQKTKIKACLLISNFNNPVGSCMPDEHKKEIVRLMEKFNVPIIEDDLYADTYFGDKRPVSCKTFDESGNVLWCSSMSKTLAPGYRAGWVAPGKYFRQVSHIKFVQSIACTTLTHEVVADFLENGRYENHLRNLRQTLRLNSMQFLRAVSEYFPEGTKVNRPSGGFFLWLEFPKKFDAVSLYEQALKHRISISPGKLFTLQNQFHNCIRLSYGMKWDPKLEQSLKVLGRLAKEES
ncbi:MAG: PLP-dependent aminotransferase family protein [Flavitalea sp.]